jgi:hypothetical protein
VNDELRELITLEDYLNRLLRRFQRRIIASGGTIPDDGNICGLSKAEAVAEIEEESAQASTNPLPSSDAELEEVAWLERHIGQVTPTSQPQVSVSSTVTVASKVKKSAKSR